ncbi:hypothetical protein BJ741DRAFT_577994 [Chytriomyces cf. hyalinus JEL632]|nr:hypothetical protein BJ741DRAFT_577994 [Chytriomyces cf. hyalinus JEL632]
MYKMNNCIQILAIIAEQAKTSKELAEKLAQLSNTSQALAELDQQLKTLVLKRVSSGEPHQVKKFTDEPGSQAKDGTNQVAASIPVMAQAQRVPPAFPLDDEIQETEEELLKRKTFAEKFYMWRASAGDCLTAFLQPRSNNSESIHHIIKGNTGNVTVEANVPQEPQSRKTVINALNKCGTTSVDRATPERPSSDVRPMAPTPAPKLAHHMFKRKVPEVVIPKTQREFFKQCQGTARYTSPNIVRKESYAHQEAA